MKSLRLVLITRRFWPLVGGAEQVMSNLANQMDAEGHQVRLLTARWEKHWPKQFIHREFQVNRLPHPASRGWGTLRYMRGVARWLQNNQSDFDAVLVSMLKHDAYAAIGVLKKTAIPVVIRAEGGGATGDCRWQEQNRFGNRIKTQCQLAEALIAPSRAITQELRDAGYDESRIHYVPNGVEIWDEWSKLKQGNARAILAEAHEILHVDPQSPLVVYTGRLHENKGLMDLVDCWPAVLKQWPQAKLWLIGEGPDSPRLWDRIRILNLTQQVILPGSFDDISEVLQAADAYVLPSYEEGMSLALLEAMSAGVPVVATDIAGNRQLIEDRVHGRLFPARKPAELACAISETLNQFELSRTMAARARQKVIDQYSVQRMAAQHLKIIQSSIESRKKQR